jgi:hypothetical protein
MDEFAPSVIRHTAIDEKEKAVRVDIAGSTGAYPAIDDGRGRQLGFSPITLHDVWAAYENFAYSVIVRFFDRHLGAESPRRAKGASVVRGQGCCESRAQHQTHRHE